MFPDKYAVQTEGDCNDNSTLTTSLSIRAASRKTRVYVFREFLLQTYGSYLNSSCKFDDDICIILDVAGGKGDLSWLLCNVDNLQSVIMDPWTPNKSKKHQQHHILKSVKYLRNHPEETKQRAIPGLPTYQPLATLLPKIAEKQSDDSFIDPRQLKMSLNQEFVDVIQKILVTAYSDQSSLNISQVGYDIWQEYWNDVVDNNESNSTASATKTMNITNNIIDDAHQALQIILKTKLLVGFHPDQATDHCIELAQLLDIPFCVVPCCIFPSEFPQRRLKQDDSIRVRTYEQLIQYLQEKCPQAQTAYLNFSFTETAKNMVLYTTPQLLSL